MKRSILFVAVFGVLAAFATSRAYAATVINDQDIPFSASIPNTCTGKTDTVTGTEHVHVNETLSSTDGVHLSLEAHVANLTVTDPTLGKCSGQDRASDVVNTTTSMLPFSATLHTSASIECSGADAHFSVDEQLHITINPDGTVTVSFDNFDITCN